MKSIISHHRPASITTCFWQCNKQFIGPQKCQPASGKDRPLRRKQTAKHESLYKECTLKGWCLTKNVDANKSASTALLTQVLKVKNRIGTKSIFPKQAKPMVAVAL